MNDYYRTIWTVDERPDKEVNALMTKGWRLVDVTVLALPNEMSGVLQANFFTTLVYDRDEPEGVPDERFNAL